MPLFVILEIPSRSHVAEWNSSRLGFSPLRDADCSTEGKVSTQGECGRNVKLKVWNSRGSVSCLSPLVPGFKLPLGMRWSASIQRVQNLNLPALPLVTLLLLRVPPAFLSASLQILVIPNSYLFLPSHPNLVSLRLLYSHSHVFPFLPLF